MNILDELKYRGLIYQITNERELAKRLVKPIILYCGFDPTAESLHLGNLLQILVLKRFQNAGHKAIALIGGATGLIGDPSGKEKERPLSKRGTVEKWSEKIKVQLKSFFDFKGKNKAKIVNNYDWFENINYAKKSANETGMTVIDYLRTYGKFFSVNEMLAKESVKTRLETGISFTEFNYMILQAIDFLELYQDHKCELQIGGSDQWGNITAGVDLIRKIHCQTVFGLTVPLIEKSNGLKFGKTESGAIWLDKNLTTPYEFYQFWMNTSDQDVIKLIKFFTFLDKDEINKLELGVRSNPEKREAQKRLAYEVTKIVHGEKVARVEKVNSEAWFSKRIEDFTVEEIEISFKRVPSYKIHGKEMPLLDLLIKAGIEKSKRQAREDVQNKAISINGQPCFDIAKQITKNDFLYKKYLVIRKGKKNYFLVKW